jgi:hypothetical protein
MPQKTQTCPYLDLDDTRCSERLTMSQIADVYRLCLGQPSDCPVYDDLHTQCDSCPSIREDVCVA